MIEPAKNPPSAPTTFTPPELTRVESELFDELLANLPVAQKDKACAAVHKLCSAINQKGGAYLTIHAHEQREWFKAWLQKTILFVITLVGGLGALGFWAFLPAKINEKVTPAVNTAVANHKASFDNLTATVTAVNTKLINDLTTARVDADSAATRAKLSETKAEGAAVNIASKADKIEALTAC